MAKSSEISHSKNVTNLETLIITCAGFGVDYNPSNPNISLISLKVLHDNAKLALKSVKEKETNFNSIEGERKLKFAPVRPLATKVLNALKASSVMVTVIKDAETINRKIQGKRADNSTSTSQIEEKNIDNPDEEQMPSKDKKSVSQQSFDMQIDHLEKLIELVSLEPKYAPNETPIKVDSLQSFKNELESLNTKVKASSTEYKIALNDRNTLFYAQETGLVETTIQVKNYIKSVFGATSQQYKQVSKLTFKNLS